MTVFTLFAIEKVLFWAIDMLRVLVLLGRFAFARHPQKSTHMITFLPTGLV